MDKIQARCITPNELKTAQKLVGRENVFRAIDLIEYRSELKGAMEFIFGSTLVATNLEVANKLAFSREVGKYTVTLEGDTVNPSGALSGGKQHSYVSFAFCYSYD